MATVTIKCPACDYETDDVEIGAATAQLQIHGYSHAVQPAITQTASTPAPASSREPKLVRPKIKLNSTNEQWNAFSRRWETFKVGSNITPASASTQLLECADDTLGDIVLRAYPDFTSKPIDQALLILKSIAVVPVALGVLRSELNSMMQDPDEPFRTFAAKVQGKAETCEFRTKFSCKCSVATCAAPIEGITYYTEEQIRDVLLQGIADVDIRREALSVQGIQERTVPDIIAFVETRETARNANPANGINTMSSYKRSSKPTPPKRSKSPSPAEKAQTAACPGCGAVFNLFTKKRYGWNTKPHLKCPDCWKKDLPHTSLSQQQQQQSQTGQNGAISSMDQMGQLTAISCATEEHDSPPSMDQMGQLTAISGAREENGPHMDVHVTAIAPPTSPASPPSIATLPPVTITSRKKRKNHGWQTRHLAAMTHHIFTKGAWRRAQNASHPTLPLSISACNIPHKRATTDGVADSGAMYDVWSLQEYLNAGFLEKDLLQVSLNLTAANKSPILINGAFFAEITGHSVNGQPITAKVMIYVSKDVKGFYLSETTMFSLGILSKNFPTPGCALAASSKSNEKDFEEEAPPRRPLPPRIETLPFECTKENIPKMKDHLLEYYKYSVFNNRSEDPLPEMAGPPLDIHIDEDAEPFACHKATPVPIHWDEEFHEDLLKDVNRDVLERVPHGEPVTHCHKVVLRRKPGGPLRRTVDYSPLNRKCKRETHSMEPPAIVARRVPPNTWKTVTDAADGYHSIPLRESDRHLTTFITTHGRFRYKRAPQGFLSSGDAFNRRFDAILADFTRKERLSDDTLHYDTDLEEHWWRTIVLLDTVGRNGMVLNPTKFQFCQREVDFVGFRITEERIDPHPKYFSAIRDFPTPRNATDIKSWFGLVNQVATFSQLRDMMAPFRQFLSPKNPFQWSPELDQAFISAKEAIISAIREGIEIFDPQRRTCLRPDWSKKGIGYFLFQQHCQCTSKLPNCCPDGWRITLAGSRFLQSAEERYAPIEGEALAVAWGLEQTRFFTQGCDDLLVVTDHKPLVKSFGDQLLDEIRNTRTSRLKQRALPWRFSINHLPGSSNCAADAI